jgi:hypothetical protein
MNNIYIEATDVTPLVSLNTNEECNIEGKAIPEDPVAFFKPVFEWVEQVNTEHLIMNVNLVYFNTSVSKHLMDFFRKLEDNPKITAITINWHYEEGDEEIQESGEIYQELLERTNFRFIEFAEVL